MNNYEKTYEIRNINDKNWFPVDNKFLDDYSKFLGIYTIGVYNSLCRHADKEQKAFPTQELMTEELDICKNKVINGIKYLEFWGIIKKIRLGCSCSNRYFLLRRSTWKPISEQTLKEFSEVYRINFKDLQDKLLKFTTRTSRVSKLKNKNTKEKEKDISLRELIENYKKGDRSYKPYYKDQPMGWSEKKQMWHVVTKDYPFSEFGDKESTIEFRKKVDKNK